MYRKKLPKLKEVALTVSARHRLLRPRQVPALLSFQLLCTDSPARASRLACRVYDYRYEETKWSILAVSLSIIDVRLKAVEILPQCSPEDNTAFRFGQKPSNRPYSKIVSVLWWSTLTAYLIFTPWERSTLSARHQREWLCASMLWSEFDWSAASLTAIACFSLHLRIVLLDVQMRLYTMGSTVCSLCRMTSDTTKT